MPYKDPEKEQEKGKRWRRKHPDYYQRWMKKNPNYHKIYKKNNPKKFRNFYESYYIITKNLLLKRDGSKCGVCHKIMKIGEISVDHIIPINMSGTNEANNIRLVHINCNNHRPKKYL